MGGYKSFRQQKEGTVPETSLNYDSSCKVEGFPKPRSVPTVHWQGSQKSPRAALPTVRFMNGHRHSLGSLKEGSCHWGGVVRAQLAGR